MGIPIKTWLTRFFGLDGSVKGSDGKIIANGELFEAIQEYRLRELALNVCVNYIANAVGKCEFKTFANREPIKGGEYWLWNVEPNSNQNSTAFLHELITKLCINNEVLVITTKARSGEEMLVVADSFEKPLRYPQKMNEYKNVVVGEVTYSKTFKENEVLHLRLNHINIKPVLDAMTESFNRMMNLATKNYNWQSGKHLKVHIGRAPQGNDEEQATFNDILGKQIKPFFTGDNSILPEYEGYDYQEFPSGSKSSSGATRDIRSLADDIFDFTARAFCIPPVLIFGDVAGSGDAVSRWLTTCIDPLCDQLQEEINRKRYGKDEFIKGNYLQIDTTTITHFDMFANAADVEKLIGSGAYSINDVLAAAGQPTINADWANAHWLTLNISPIEMQARAVYSNTEGGVNSG